MKTSNEIRNTFINFFVNHGHKVIESSSLIPKDDPSLLWNNAGVTPLKKYFDGSAIPDSKRLVSIQKCLRTNDIESVGDDSHHTFFEMLGNFSIGDYFKKEAIEMSFELLTSKEYFNIDINKLYVTIYSSDEEAYNIWISVGMPEDHIVRLESNYWEIGEGPCGPDSEIFYDRGIEFDKENIGVRLLKEEISNNRYIEIWNNVFSQYNSKQGLTRNEYPELPSKNIDTGMGFERIVMVLQEQGSSYDTDLFVPIINEIERLSNKKYNGNKEFRIIADHIRAITFAIADGATFSNEGRGYVLRRLLRRAVRQGVKLGISGMFMNKLVTVVVNTMKNAYPYLEVKVDNIINVVLKEEKLFEKTLISGEKRLVELMEKNNEISGEDAFKLYDTYGFPFELTSEILEEKGYKVSKDEFEKYMNIQKEKARSSRTNESNMNMQNESLINYKDDSNFIGYNSTECSSTILKIFKDGKFIDTCSEDCYVILSETPFYAEMGGQSYDTGYIYNDNVNLKVMSVIKAPNKQHLHYVSVDGTVNVGDKVTAKIDANRRNNIERNHSATHLLQEALREVIDKNIFQSGSRVDEDNLRFDFVYSGKIDDELILKVENKVNEYIKKNEQVNTEVCAIDVAKAKGAIALFDEKYGDVVRVVSIGDSVELCGGTHVKNTSDISLFAIKSLENKGSNTYRIEAVTNNKIVKELYERIKPYNDEMIKLFEKAKKIIDDASKDDVILKLDAKIDNSKPKSYADIIYNQKEVNEVRIKIRELEKEYSVAKSKKAISNIGELENSIVHTDSLDYLVTKINNYNLNILKQLVDVLLTKMNKGFIFIANINDNNVNYISKCSKENINIHCGELVKIASSRSDGNGGGSQLYGQGGGTSIENVDVILEEICKVVINQK